MLKTSAGPEARNPSPLSELAVDLDKYASDPYGWVLYAFPWGEPGTELACHSGPDRWQEDILKDIGQRLFRASKEDARWGAIIREATASGHGIGKSTLVAWLILWAVTTLEDTRGVVTANTEKQLGTKTWPELAKWFRLCWFTGGVPGAKRGLFEVTVAAIYCSDPKHQKTWRIDQVPWNERNTEAFAGLHNKGRRILLVFDEASAIPDVICTNDTIVKSAIYLSLYDNITFNPLHHLSAQMTINYCMDL